MRNPEESHRYASVTEVNPRKNLNESLNESITDKSSLPLARNTDFQKPPLQYSSVNQYSKKSGYSTLNRSVGNIDSNESLDSSISGKNTSLIMKNQQGESKNRYRKPSIENVKQFDGLLTARSLDNIFSDYLGAFPSNFDFSKGNFLVS